MPKRLACSVFDAQKHAQVGWEKGEGRCGRGISTEGGKVRDVWVIHTDNICTHAPDGRDGGVTVLLDCGIWGIMGVWVD